MKKRFKMYKYFGRNGGFITTPLIINGATDVVSMITITADEGKILTNGTFQVYEIMIEESELSNWWEIKKPE